MPKRFPYDFFPGSEPGLRKLRDRFDESVEEVPLPLPGETPETTRRAAGLYRSARSMAGDRWGNAWVLVVVHNDHGGWRSVETQTAYSMGPDAKFDWGTGDDLLVYPTPKLKPLRRDLLLLGAFFVISCYVSLRLFFAPLATRTWLEAIRAVLISLPLGLLVAKGPAEAKSLLGLVETLDQPKLLATKWVVVLTVQGLLIVAVFGVRVRWAAKNRAPLRPSAGAP